MSKRINKNDANVIFPVVLSTELVDDLAQPIIAAIEIEEDDEAAKAIITAFRALASENDPEIRESFASDLALRIYPHTRACRDAALAFS